MTQIESIGALSEELRRAGGTLLNILLTGETGSGKEHVARALHRCSPHAAGPFVVVNLAAIPESLVEAELFGVVAGAFTDAAGPRRGRFAMADDGTLLLDEIGSVSGAVQAKLLRVLQERRYLPVGSGVARPMSARIMAADKADLQALVEAGRFRRDLLHRLAMVSVHVAPLRERRAELPALIAEIDREVCEDAAGRPLCPEVVALLGRYAWPGNVRQLRNVLTRIRMQRLQDSPEVVEQLLPAAETTGARKTLRGAIRRAFRAAHRSTGGDIGLTAGLLGISRATAYRYLGDAT